MKKPVKLALDNQLTTTKKFKGFRTFLVPIMLTRNNIAVTRKRTSRQLCDKGAVIIKISWLQHKQPDIEVNSSGWRAHKNCKLLTVNKDVMWKTWS